MSVQPRHFLLSKKQFKDVTSLFRMKAVSSPSDSGKRERYIIALISGAIGSIAMSIISVPAQYFLASHQIREELSSWQIKEVSKLDIDERQRQRKLVRDFRELHEELLAADTMFTFASELLAFEHTLENYSQSAPKLTRMRLDQVFSKVARNMGLSGREAYFTDASKQYVEKRAKLVGLLSEIDFYYSDDVVVYARKYYKHISTSDVTALERARHWDGVVKNIAEHSANGKFDTQQTAQLIYENIKSLQRHQFATVALYNDVYEAMRKEVVAYK